MSINTLPVNSLIKSASFALVDWDSQMRNWKLCCLTAPRFTRSMDWLQAVPSSPFLVFLLRRWFGDSFALKRLEEYMDQNVSNFLLPRFSVRRASRIVHYLCSAPCHLPVIASVQVISRPQQILSDAFAWLRLWSEFPWWLRTGRQGFDFPRILSYQDLYTEISKSLKKVPQRPKRFPGEPTGYSGSLDWNPHIL